VWIEGRPDPPPGEFQLMTFITVSENYLEVTGIQILRGRGIRREDDVRSPDVVVVNEAFARRYFPGQDPINRRIGYGARSDPHYWRTIVGLVADTREQLGESPRPTAYAPFRQTLEPWNFASYLVKTSLPVGAGGEAVQKAVLASDPDQPVSRLRPVEADMRATIATQRFTTIIAGTFAGLWRHDLRGRRACARIGGANGAGRDTRQNSGAYRRSGRPGRPERRSFRCRRCTRNGTIDSDIAVRSQAAGPGDTVGDRVHFDCNISCCELYPDPARSCEEPDRQLEKRMTARDSIREALRSGEDI
jgi:hypothetical protein